MDVNSTASLAAPGPEMTASQVIPQADSQYPMLLNADGINLTIHSTKQVTHLRDFTPYPGNVFIVVDAAIRNDRDHGEFLFGNSGIYLYENGAMKESYPITGKLAGGIDNPFTECSIEPGAERRGNIVFGVSKDTTGFTLVLVEERGETLLSTGLPVDLLEQNKGQDGIGSLHGGRIINVTIHSALKTMQIQNLHPKSGYVYIVVNATIENPSETDTLLVSEKTISLAGDRQKAQPRNQRMYDNLTNPIYWGRIPAQKAVTGELAFSIMESCTFTLTFLDESGQVVLTEQLGDVPEGSYPDARADAGMRTGEDFTTTVESLDTAVKAARYTNDRFTFTFHNGCTSYPPDKFFQLMKGDCKDYATFLSYVLAYHGYDAKIVAFSYHINNIRYGHVVTLFTDTDGTMKYATTPDVTVFREADSIDDLLKKECSRLGASSIADYRILPAGSVDCCTG